MADLERIKGSDGTGEAVRAVVQSIRLSGSTTLDVDSLSNWPTKFIGLYGTPDGNNSVVGSSVRVFYGEISGVDINITGFAPGYTDNGNSVGDIVVLKPTTAWADELASFLDVSHDTDGSLNTAAVLESLGIGGTPTPDWAVLPYAPNTVTYNGNRSYDLVFNGTDVTGAVNPGTRIRTTRSVAAPTQSTSLNGTNQYWVKTSPNKLTFTDDFVVSAWVKLSNYAFSTVISRNNGTNGWALFVNADGTVTLNGYNGGLANSSIVKSYQSLPLNKWVHIAAQLDMSTFTASTTTSYVMIDGVDVPASVSRSGTNPTALVQAGNLEVGSYNGGTSPFPGKIAQAAVFSAKVTQATIKTYYSQGLSGSETNLASAYSFNGVTTDLNTTTPNDLTAQNSAGYTADSPFGGQASGLISSTLDYGIVQSATFSTNTTLTVQVPEGCTIPTSGGVASVSYSSVKAPYGFPAEAGKWRVEYIGKVQGAKTTGITLGTFYSVGGNALTVPIGAWGVSYRAYAQHTATSQQYLTHNVVLTTSSDNTALASLSGVGTLPVSALISNAGSNGANVGQWDNTHVLPTKFTKLSSATAVNLLISAVSGSSNNIYINGMSPNGDVSINFDNAYL